MNRPISRATRRRGAIAVGIVLATSLTGCSSPSPQPSSGSTASLGSCGTVPTVAPVDAGGLLASLPKNVSANYNGYAAPVRESMWADWKPSHQGPYTAAIVFNPPFNPFQVTMHKAVLAELAANDVQVVADLAPAAPTDVPQQLQQLQQAIAKKPDVIIFEPLAAGPSVAAVDAAGKAGIPVVSVFNAIDSTAAVSVGLNNFQQSAAVAAEVFTTLGGKGTALRVHGIPGITQDTDAGAGFAAAAKQCPGIKVVGEVTGNYSNAAAQSAVVQYLATNPSGVDAVLQSGGMGLGVLQAFEQSGRKPPLITDNGSSRAMVAYAEAHPSYQYFGTPSPDAQIGTVMAQVAVRLLAGQGPKMNQFVTVPQYITRKNLASVYKEGWSLTDTTDAEGDPSAFFDTAYLDSFFTDPTAKLR